MFGGILLNWTTSRVSVLTPFEANCKLDINSFEILSLQPKIRCLLSMEKQIYPILTCYMGTHHNSHVIEKACYFSTFEAK